MTKVISIQKSPFPTPFTIIHVLRVIGVYRVYVVEILQNDELLHVSSHLCTQWRHVGRLKWATVGSSALWKIPTPQIRAGHIILLMD